MTGTQQSIWLTQDAYQQLTDELAELVKRNSGSDGKRIRRLREVLKDPIIGQAPLDDGIAEPGMVVTIKYDDDPDTERLLLAEPAEYPTFNVSVCSPHSPLGEALIGTKVGERRQYGLPNGKTMTITLLRAVPYAQNPRSH